jgi:hypothetical protein
MCQNLYVNEPQAPALSKRQLFGTPGITSLGTTGATLQANRGSRTKNGIVYFVNGDTLYVLQRSFDVKGVETLAAVSLGTIEGEGRVSMADNGTQLMVLVPGGKGYIYNEDAGTPFQEITDSDFTANGAPQHLVFVDGSFLVTTDSKKYIISDLNDGLSWNALNSGTAESDPDAIVAPVVASNQVYLTGSITTEGVENVGSSGGSFPFQRNNVFLDKGCLAPFSIVKSQSTFFMIGAGKDEGPAIWRFNGNDFEKKSTTAIDSILNDYTDEELSESFAMAYAKSGAYFLLFCFPDRTLVYNQVNNFWHERKSTINEVERRWRVNSLVTAYGRTIVFDSIDGRFGELRNDVYTEYGNNIIRLFTTQPFSGAGEISVVKYELTMEAGVGDSNTPNPMVSMAISTNGKTFGPERSRPIGKVGEFFKRTIWRKNGRSPRNIVLLFRLSDPVKPVFIRLEFE